jgi:anti-sigma factor RsiW
MNQSTCNNLDDYLADELDDRRRTEFETHLEACPACREELVAQAELTRLLRAATEMLEASPAELPAGVNRGLAATAARRGRSVGAAVLIAAVVVCAAWWGLHEVRDGKEVVRPQPEPRVVKQRRTNADEDEDRRQKGESETANMAETAVAAPPAEVQVASSSEMIAVPIKSESPNVTIFWLYPAVRTAGR